jgi:ribosomal-protein-alanine N-acetyltransferase
LLLDTHLDTARERDATQLLLEVRADNVAAQRLYAKRGFEQIARRRGYYGDTDGIIMRLRPLR